MSQNIYLDYAASTPMKKEVLDVMIPYMTEFYGNASSIHGFGRKVHQALEQSRRTLAKLMNASHDELYFLSGGTEANNWALKGIAESYADQGKHIVVSSIEHPAVLNTAKSLEAKGFRVSYVAPNQKGIVTLDAVKAAITKETILVSIMFINNEIGTLQPIQAIGTYCRDNKILFHTDAVQAFGYQTIDVKALNIDLMTISSHKLYGPTGIGALYIRKGVKIKSLLDGGAQERKRRAGTSHVAGAVGFAKAAQIRYDNLESLISELKSKRDYLLEGLKKNLDNITLNGDIENRHPGSLNILFENISGEMLLMNLDLEGIAVSSGSACSSGSVNPSHVLLALGLDKKAAKSSVRMSVGDNTTYKELDCVIEKITQIITRLRG